MKTFIKQKKKIILNNPIMILGFPGLGYVGKISVTYLIKRLKAIKKAELYSPFFPYHVIVNSYGEVTLPKADFYYWKNKEKESNDLILLTGDSQAQTLEGQYELVENILDYSVKEGVRKIITIGGYNEITEQKEPSVICVSTKPYLLKEFLNLGAVISPEGNPIVGIAGLILGLSELKNIESICLLGETLGYMSDPKAAKKVLKVLLKFLKIELGLNILDEEIKNYERIVKKSEGFQNIIRDFKRDKLSREDFSYIS